MRTRRVECKLRGSVVSATQCKANSRPKSIGNCNARIKCRKLSSVTYNVKAVNDNIYVHGLSYRCLCPVC